MKYVMLQTADGMKLPVIFPDTMNHDLMAAMFAYAIQRQVKAQAAPVSAGFIGLGKIEVSGKSESLNDLPSNPLDGVRIMMGEAVAFMPDEMLPALARKMAEMPSPPPRKKQE